MPGEILISMSEERSEVEDCENTAIVDISQGITVSPLHGVAETQVRYTNATHKDLTLPFYAQHLYKVLARKLYKSLISDPPPSAPGALSFAHLAERRPA